VKLSVSAHDAIREYERVYCQGRGCHAWWIDAERIAMWKRGERSFGPGGDLWTYWPLYVELKKWVWYRPQYPPPADFVYRILSELKVLTPTSDRLRTLSLDRLTLAHVPDLRRILTRASEIKTNDSGPSLVAVSKNLHFFNRRLFVVVDDAEMQAKALSQPWLADEIRAVQDEMDDVCPPDPKMDVEPFTRQGLAYSAILFWASRFAQNHPEILRAFDEYVYHKNYFRARYDGCQATAVEVYLLGAASLLRSRARQSA